MKVGGYVIASVDDKLGDVMALVHDDMARTLAVWSTAPTLAAIAALHLEVQDRPVPQGHDTLTHRGPVRLRANHRLVVWRLEVPPKVPIRE